MFLLPGCKCCGGACEWPDGNTLPDSIEIAIANTASSSYTIESTSGGIDRTATIQMPSQTGTYSLENYTDTSDVSEWFFFAEDSNDPAAIIFRRIGNMSTGKSEFVSEIDINLAVPYSWTDSGGGSGNGLWSITNMIHFHESCNVGTLTRWADPDWAPGPWFDTFTAEYDDNCCLPGTVTGRAWMTKPYGTTSHTFPYTKTDGGTDYLGFDITFQVVSVNFVYGVDAIPGFEDIGQTDCLPP